MSSRCVSRPRQCRYNGVVGCTLSSGCFYAFSALCSPPFYSIYTQYIFPFHFYIVVAMSGRTIFVVRLHFEYDRENYSRTEAAFTNKQEAQRFTISRVCDQKTDNDCAFLRSETLATLLKLPIKCDDILEEVDERDDIDESLRNISNPTELEAIYRDAMQSQSDSRVETTFHIDEIVVDIASQA
jgi:hypothetical protein